MQDALSTIDVKSPWIHNAMALFALSVYAMSYPVMASENLAIIDDRFSETGMPSHGDIMLALFSESAGRPIESISTFPVDRPVVPSAVSRTLRSVLSEQRTLVSMSLTFDVVSWADNESKWHPVFRQRWIDLTNRDWLVIQAAGNDARMHKNDWPTSPLIEHTIVAGTLEQGIATQNRMPGHTQRESRYVVLQGKAVAHVDRPGENRLIQTGGSSSATARLSGWIARLARRYPGQALVDLSRVVLDSADFDGLPVPGECKNTDDTECLARYYGQGQVSWKGIESLAATRFEGM